ncbi:hypothetical protein [Acetobacterium bakii]|nr:hypothetical protein [Acetobacterium bakii]
MSIFGTYEHIKPGMNTIQILMDAFKGFEGEIFIPSTIEIQKIELPINTLITETRLKMMSISKKWEILFMPDRIDANYNGSDVNGEVQKESIKELVDFSKKILDLALSAFDLKGGRLAVNCRRVMKKLNSDEIDDFQNKLINPLNFYNDKLCNDWSLMINGNDNIEINDKTESLNVITNISLGKLDKIDDPVRIILVFDINTKPDNMSIRFGIKNLGAFGDRCVKMIGDLVVNIEGLVSL